MSEHIFNWTMALLGVMVCVFLGALALIVLWLIWTDRIRLDSMLQEPNGNASMSRFQLFVFTMVIAFSFFYLVAESSNRQDGKFPQVPDGVLVLLGISASTYAVGKGISFSRDEGVKTPEQLDKDRNVRREKVQADKEATINKAPPEVEVASSDVSIHT